MSEQGSVTRWLFDLTNGDDDDAARGLWDRYFLQLAKVARQSLSRNAPVVVDEEDVALSALHSFIQQRSRGDFPDLRDRDDLWRLLAFITRRKALNAIRHELAERRGGDQLIDIPAEVFPILCAEPAPDQATELLDEVHRLLEVILGPRQADLRTIAAGKLRGASNAELAGELGVSVRTVERKVELIRKLWEEDLEARGDP